MFTHLSKLILSVSMYVVTIGAVSRAPTISCDGCNTRISSGDTIFICSTNTCLVSWSTSIMVALSSAPKTTTQSHMKYKSPYTSRELLEHRCTAQPHASWNNISVLFIFHLRNCRTHVFYTVLPHLYSCFPLSGYREHPHT